MPSSGASWRIRRCSHAAPLDKEEPRTPYTRSSQNSPSETVWKFSGTCQPPHHQPYHRCVDERFRACAQPLVVHRLMRRFWPNQEKVRSTTHRRGKATYPRGGISLSQSIYLPSLAHSLAQIFATSSGTGLGGLRTTSTLKPITSSAHFLPLPSYPASTTGASDVKARSLPTAAEASARLGPGPSRCAPWL